MTTVTESVQEAVDVLRRGGLVAFPTETVYGLGADAFDAAAVERIFAAKGRPSDNPMIVHLANAEQLPRVARQVPAAAAALLSAFAPGPLAVVVPKHPNLPDVVTAGLDTVAVRIPGHPVARALLESFDNPVAAPSANRSGRPSPTDWQSAVAELDGRVDIILRGPPSTVGLESTVVYCAGDEPVVLRPGGIPASAIAEVLGLPVSKIAGESDQVTSGSVAVHSPGTRHRHYAPTARVQIVPRRDAQEDAAAGIPIPSGKPALNCGYIGLLQPPPGIRFRLSMWCPTPDAYARELYGFFRACEEARVNTIYCESVSEEGIGAAIMDRLRRAAAATSSE